MYQGITNLKLLWTVYQPELEICRGDCPNERGGSESDSDHSEPILDGRRIPDDLEEREEGYRHPHSGKKFPHSMVSYNEKIWGQFHQHSMCSFYVPKFRSQLFCAYVLCLYFTGARLLAQKLCVEC